MTSPTSASLKSPDRSALDKIAEKKTDELVIALCGPIGTPLHEVGQMLTDILKNTYEYEAVPIRLSDFIRRSYQARHGHKLTASTRFDEISALIEEGDRLRTSFGLSILAELAVREIAAARAGREASQSAAGNTPARVCHIVDSVKNQEELDLLRSVYGDLLYCVGVFCPPHDRWNRLEREGMKPAEIGKLIDHDSGQEIPSGQTVAETFPEADYFLRTDERGQALVLQRLSRFIDIVLGSAIRTPTANETAMYMAATAACNSACLARQVGAAIVSADGELLSIGWNDVPKFGGNLYTVESPADHRCYLWNSKECHNEIEKWRLAEAIVSDLHKQGFIVEDKKADAVNALKTSRVRHLLEFSRSIHAEMHAIIMAGQMAKGTLKGARLFCTTYPCHSCARHIIAAGISEIYFIEPYTKSLATQLHSDAIADGDDAVGKVRLIPFDGVAPNRYRALFEMTQPRKSAGRLVNRSPQTARVRLASHVESFPALEAVVVEHLKQSNAS